MVKSKILRLCLEKKFIFYFQKLVFGNIKKKTILFLFLKYPLDIFFQPLFLFLIIIIIIQFQVIVLLKGLKEEKKKKTNPTMFGIVFNSYSYL